MTISHVLGLSIVLQFLAAALALRLIWVTGRQAAWLLISVATLLMAVRRCISFSVLTPQDIVVARDLVSELVGLGISLLMVVGIGLIGSIFGSLRRRNDRLRDELSQRTSTEAALEQEKLASEGLRRQYELILNSAWEGLFGLDSEGNHTFVNPAAARMLGYEVQELVGRHSHATWHHSKQDGSPYPEGDCPIYATLRSGRVHHCRDEVFWRKDGTSFLAESMSAPIVENEKVVGAVVSFIDVTEPRRDRRELLETRERLELALKGADLGLWDLDVPSGKAVVSPRSAEILGYTLDEIAQSFDFWASLLHPQERERAVEKVRSHLAAQVDYYEDEYRVRHKSGEWRWVLSRGKVVARDADGKPLRMTGTYMDITERKLAEDALRQSESVLKTVLKAAPIGIGLVADRTFSWSNELLAQMTGYSQEELLGKSARILYENDTEFDRVGTVKYAELRATGTGSIETRWKRKDGTLIDIALRSSAIVPLDPSAGAVFTALDVTDRKRAEDTLRQSEERYRAVFDNASVGINVVNQDGALVQANPTLRSWLGYTLEEFRRLSPMDITHPDDREATREFMSSILRGDIDSFKIEKRYIKKDGSTMWGDLSVSSIRDAEGRPRMALGVIADITERKSAEIALKESEERLRLIIDASPIGIRMVQDGRYVYVNPKFLEIFGYESADEIIGVPVEGLYAPESRSLILQRVADRTARLKNTPHYEAIGLGKSGKRIDVAAWTTEMDYFGKRASLAFIRDVTESRSLRSQLVQAQKMEAIGTLAGGIAHDFNNLLTVVLGFSELLLSEDRLPAHTRPDLERIVLAGRNGADLVQRLLAFSRKADTKPRPISLNRQVEQVKQMLQRTIPKMIGIELKLANDLAKINADPTQMEQVLMNLAVNARDAMPDGGKLALETANVTLDEGYCAMHLGTNPGQYVCLTVADTGHGMDQETLSHIFEPFYTTKATGKGTGLGLAMVYGIVRQHGGHVTCHSEPGLGTTFRIYLPPIAVERSETQHISDTGRVTGGTETILLVDDDESIRDLGKRILRRAGYTVLYASNGIEALEAYKREAGRISLVILDLSMPEMGGQECCSELKKFDPAVKVLISSGYASGGTSGKAMELGARGFVGKPYNVRRLLQSVREILDAP